MFEPILTKPNALHVVPFSFDKEKLTLKEQMNGWLCLCIQISTCIVFWCVLMFL